MTWFWHNSTQRAVAIPAVGGGWGRAQALLIGCLAMCVCCQELLGNRLLRAGWERCPSNRRRSYRFPYVSSLSWYGAYLLHEVANTFEGLSDSEMYVSVRSKGPCPCLWKTFCLPASWKLLYQTTFSVCLTSWRAKSSKNPIQACDLQACGCRNNTELCLLDWNHHARVDCPWR